MKRGIKMSYLNCQESGCGGDGMVICLYIDRERKTFRWTSRCCRVCNRHDEDIFKVVEGEELVRYVVSESSLRADGFRDVMEKREVEEMHEVQLSPPKKFATR